MIKRKIKSHITHQEIGGKEFIVDEMITKTLSNMSILEDSKNNMACLNFLLRRPDFNIDFPHKIYYGKVDGLGYIVAEDELEPEGKYNNIQRQDGPNYNLMCRSIKDESEYIERKKNMKVMISIPMKGKTFSQIQEDMQKYIKEFEKLHIEVVNSIIDKDEFTLKEEYYTPGLYYIAKSIDLIGKVDAVFFAEGWRQSTGCKIERKVCEDYGVKILDIGFLYPNTSVTRLFAGEKCV